MDRFYLGRLIDDLNQRAKRIFEDTLGAHLLYFLALDSRTETTEHHFINPRYFFSLGPDCPLHEIRRLRVGLTNMCRTFSDSRLQCRLAFGSGDRGPYEWDRFLVLLQFFPLEWTNKSRDMTLAASVLGGRAGVPTPDWLAGWERVGKTAFEREILGFCQKFISSDPKLMFESYLVENAFWRLVNLACHHLEVSCYPDLVALLPKRLERGLASLPDRWYLLRRAEAPEEEGLHRCIRDSLRMCQALIELETS